MDELREAVFALAAEVRAIERQMVDSENPPSKLHLSERRVDRIQHGLNRLQTAMDTWSEEREEV